MAIFFTSDNHFGHANVIKHCGRPFENVESMDEAMARLWNETVGENDTVFHLGDFGWVNKEIPRIRAALNGAIHIIRGNHDRGVESLLKAGFDEVYDCLDLELDGCKLFLQHIPVFSPLDLETSKYKQSLLHVPPPDCDYVLCGHVHEHWKRNGKHINVGVDVWDFRPVTLSRLIGSE